MYKDLEHKIHSRLNDLLGMNNMHRNPISTKDYNCTQGACQFVTFDSTMHNRGIDCSNPPCHGVMKSVGKDKNSFIISDFKVNNTQLDAKDLPNYKKFFTSLNSFLIDKKDSPYRKILDKVDVYRDQEGIPRHFLLDYSDIDGRVAVSFCQASRMAGLRLTRSASLYILWNIFRDTMNWSELLFLAGFFCPTGVGYETLMFTPGVSCDMPFSSVFNDYNKIINGIQPDKGLPVRQQYPENINLLFATESSYYDAEMQALYNKRYSSLTNALSKVIKIKEVKGSVFKTNAPLPSQLLFSNKTLGDGSIKAELTALLREFMDECKKDR